MKVKSLLLFSAIFFLISLASASAAPYAQTKTGTVTILGQQYLNFSAEQASALSGHVLYDNRSGINIDFDISGPNGFFNATPNTIDGLGPNLNLNKTYKVPNASDTSTWGETFYVDQTFPLYQNGDGLMVRLVNNTYAAFVVVAIGMDEGKAVSITVDYYYNANGSNLFADKPTTGCAQYLNETACYNSVKMGASCYWDGWLGMCNEPDMSGGGGVPVSGGAGFTGCDKFDNNQKACGNITVCSYSNGLCDPTPGGGFSEQVGLNCSVFNNGSLCNNQPHTSPLCSWNSSVLNEASAVCLANNTKTSSDLTQPVFSTCNLASTQAECNNLTTAAYMPCEWDTGTSKCNMIFNSVYGSGGGGFGNIFDITTKSACEAVGGTWKTETYSYTNSYGQITTSTDSWCEMSFGDYSKENCADSCWACEKEPDGTNWDTAAAAKEACLNSSVGYCQFYEDSFAFNGLGWCEPDSKVGFGFMDCATNCFGCFNNASCAVSAATCTWTAEPFGKDIDGNGSFDTLTDGWCDPAALAAQKDCSQNCFACSSNASCAGSAANVSEGGCTWNPDYWYCGNTSLTPLEICFFPGDEDGNGLYDCADPACSTNPTCGFGFVVGGGGGGGGAGLGNIDSHLCIQHDNNQANCTNQNMTMSFGQTAILDPNNLTPVCYYHPAPGQEAVYPATGWCDPIFNNNLAGGLGIDTPPVILGVDPSGDAVYPWLDILGFGIHDSPQTIDVGIAVRNMTNFTACYKSYNSAPDRVNASGKYYRYFDTDSNTTNGCTSDNDNTIKGFEYKFIHTANNNESNASIYPFYNSTFDNTPAYKCVAGSWVPFAAQASFMADGCLFGTGNGELEQGIGQFGGIDILLIKKTDIGSPKVPIRIYVTTHNGSNVTIDSAGPSYYTPGSIDFKFEDCSATGQDFDGDGLNAENDPDCQKFIKLGYVPFEGGPQCKDGKDNDGNGLTDCDDSSCKYDPYSGCGFALTCDPKDKNAPQVKWQSVNALPNSANVKFDSNEPANGTLFFYNLSSTCATLNATIFDIGIIDSNVPTHKPWHSADIGINTVGFNLNANTTYYYKYQMCDLCGNCLISKCTNFTTPSSFKSFIFKPTLDENITMSIPKLNITNNTFAYGKKLNQSNTKNVQVMFNDTFNNYGITLQNCTITQAFDVNLSGALVYNSSTQAAGMNTAKWDEISQKLGCKYIKMTLPETSKNDQFWHCDENNVSNCYQVTSDVSCTFSSTSTQCTIPVSQGLGFSVYEARTAPTTTPPASPTSSGGGGGGGGGGGTVVTTNLAAKSSRLWDAIAADDLTLFSVKSEKISVSLVSFSLSKQAENVEVTVGTLTTLPSEVKETGLTVYQNLQITHSNIQNKDVSSANIEFSVTLDWLSSNNVAAGGIALYRYYEATSSWEELATTHLRSDLEKAYYSAKSPGLSYFAIAAKKATIAEAAPTEEPKEVTAPTGAVVQEPEQKVTVEVPEKAGLPSWGIYAALTVVVLIAAAAIVEYEKKKKKPKNPEL